MSYVPVPKDLTKVKTKVAFNLTKRQLVCFGCGALIGVTLFFLLRGPAGNSVAAMCMMLVMLPFFMLAMYEKHGQPLEKDVYKRQPFALSLSATPSTPPCGIGAGNTKEKYPLNTSQKKSTTH